MDGLSIDELVVLKSLVIIMIIFLSSYPFNSVILFYIFRYFNVDAYILKTVILLEPPVAPRP